MQFVLIFIAGLFVSCGTERTDTLNQPQPVQATAQPQSGSQTKPGDDQKSATPGTRVPDPNSPFPGPRPGGTPLSGPLGDVDGHWVSGCEADRPGFSSNTKIDISSGSFTAQVWIYRDARCMDVTSIIENYRMQGTVNISSEPKLLADQSGKAWDIDFVVVAKWATPFSDTATRSFQYRFRQPGWQVGEEHPISPKASPVFIMGISPKNIVAIEGDKLVFGYEDGLHDGLRPDLLDRSKMLNKSQVGPLYPPQK